MPKKMIAKAISKTAKAINKGIKKVGKKIEDKKNEKRTLERMKQQTAYNKEPYNSPLKKEMDKKNFEFKDIKKNLDNKKGLKGTFENYKKNPENMKKQLGTGTSYDEKTRLANKKNSEELQKMLKPAQPKTKPKTGKEMADEWWQKQRDEKKEMIKKRKK